MVDYARAACRSPSPCSTAWSWRWASRSGRSLISIIAAFTAIVVYFHFPLRMACFWAIFVTLMLPVEVRIVPTYGVVASSSACHRPTLGAGPRSR